MTFPSYEYVAQLQRWLWCAGAASIRGTQSCEVVARLRSEPNWVYNVKYECWSNLFTVWYLRFTKSMTQTVPSIIGGAAIRSSQNKAIKEKSRNKQKRHMTSGNKLLILRRFWVIFSTLIFGVWWHFSWFSPSVRQNRQDEPVVWTRETKAASSKSQWLYL